MTNTDDRKHRSILLKVLIAGLMMVNGHCQGMLSRFYSHPAGTWPLNPSACC